VVCPFCVKCIITAITPLNSGKSRAAREERAPNSRPSEAQTKPQQCERNKETEHRRDSFPIRSLMACRAGAAKGLNGGVGQQKHGEADAEPHDEAVRFGPRPWIGPRRILVFGSR